MMTVMMNRNESTVLGNAELCNLQLRPEALVSSIYYFYLFYAIFAWEVKRNCVQISSRLLLRCCVFWLDMVLLYFLIIIRYSVLIATIISPIEAQVLC